MPTTLATKEDLNFNRIVSKQFDRAAHYLKIHPALLSQIKACNNVYYFQFPTNRCSAAARLVGTDVSCELWLALAEPARVVPKLALVLHEPSVFQNRRWNEGLAKLAPGAEVLVEGQTDLAILIHERAEEQ